jgi:hypothetical protein
MSDYDHVPQRDIGDAEVSIAEGAEVSLAAGTEVGLAAGTEVGLTEGTEVGLASGAEVDLATGAEVAVTGDVSVVPFQAIQASGFVELIGPDEQVAQNDWGGSVSVGIDSGVSGEILSIVLIFTESGSGSLITQDGRLCLFKGDPDISVGDAVVGEDEWHKLLASIPISEDDWFKEATGTPTGATVYIYNVPIAFEAPGAGGIYAAYHHLGATTINSDAGDDEALDMKIRYRRDS